jgi:hypothetical protein
VLISQVFDGSDNAKSTGLSQPLGCGMPLLTCGAPRQSDGLVIDWALLEGHGRANLNWDTNGNIGSRNSKGSNMPSHVSPKSQPGERIYLVVAISRDGGRTNISPHKLCLDAEQARTLIVPEEGIEIRIEMAVEPAAVGNGG